MNLTVTGLHAGYPGRPLLAGWSHTFAPGLTWVQGPNGCGKSTLLKVLGGALPAWRGTLRLGDTDAHHAPLAWRLAVGWCGPDALAFGHLCADEYAGFLAGLYPRFNVATYDRAADALGLAPWRGTRILALSSGTQRKLALAAMLAAGTTVLLLDEPMASLDASSQEMLRALLDEAAAQTQRIWIVTSHEPLGTTAQTRGQRVVLG